MFSMIGSIAANGQPVGLRKRTEDKEWVLGHEREQTGINGAYGRAVSVIHMT